MSENMNNEDLKYRSLFNALNMFPILKENMIDRSDVDDSWIIYSPSINKEGVKYNTMFRIYDDPKETGVILEMTVYDEMI